MGDRGAYRVLVGRPGKPRFRWEDIIKIDLKERGREGVIAFLWLRMGTGGAL
jgi:hypothetical protein